MARRPWLTVPNGITLFRLLLVPVFLVFHLTGNPDWALGCFGLAAVSDALDGMLARLLRQQSKLGAFLDPIADKVLVFAALCSLVLERRVPLWLLGVIAFRDAFMIAGTLVVRHKHLELPSAPSRVGKYATFALVLMIVMALSDQIIATSALFHAYTQAVGVVAGFCVTVSTVQYFVRYGYLFFAPARPGPQP